jgi:hypothetical protein
MTDPIYKRLFLSMLEENKGCAGQAVDAVIDELLAKIKSESAPRPSADGR